MSMLMEKNLTSNDRATCIGFAILLATSSLLLSVDPIWIAALELLATYPLLTGLAAIDPVLVVVEIVKQKRVH